MITANLKLSRGSIPDDSVRATITLEVKALRTIEFHKNYVSHYMILERDFEETKQYVTIAEDNFEAYSVAYLKQLLAIGSEIDVLLEVVAKEYEPNLNESGFGCSKVLLNHEPD